MLRFLGSAQSVCTQRAAYQNASVHAGWALLFFFTCMPISDIPGPTLWLIKIIVSVTFVLFVQQKPLVDRYDGQSGEKTQKNMGPMIFIDCLL